MCNKNTSNRRNEIVINFHPVLVFVGFLKYQVDAWWKHCMFWNCSPFQDESMRMLKSNASNCSHPTKFVTSFWQGFEQAITELYWENKHYSTSTTLCSIFTWSELNPCAVKLSKMFFFFWCFDKPLKQNAIKTEATCKCGTTFCQAVFTLYEINVSKSSVHCFVSFSYQTRGAWNWRPTKF